MAKRFRAKTALALATALLLAGNCLAQMHMPMGATGEPGDDVPPGQLPAPQRLTGIGNVRFPISTNAEGASWFEQGINLLYDFWDYEADRAFEQSVRTDPKCAMCYWGLYQAEIFRSRETQRYALDALNQAAAFAPNATPRERLYIQASQAHEAAIAQAGSGEDTDFSKEIGILRKLVKENPTDSNARMYLAEAVQDGYDKSGQPRPGEKECHALLSSVLHDEPDNSAANHLWIHAVEASPHPEQALHSAETLSSLAPASGHMVHMPGHIFYRLGDYSRAQAAFDDSTRVDESYMRAQHIAVDNDWNYVHNLMYSVANLLEEGRFQEALRVSAKLRGARGHREDTLYPWSARDAIARINPELPVALRTADWARILKLVDAANLPNSMPHLEFLAGGLSEFALGMQATEAHEPDVAERHSVLLDASLWRLSEQVKDDDAQRKQPKGAASTPPMNMSMSPDPLAKPLLQTLSIMSLELRGAMLATQGQLPAAVKLFANAQAQEKALGYREPPSYIRPVGESEAAALMVAGKWAEAEGAYRQALIERPKSGFPLYGIALVKEESGDVSGATAAYREFLDAWKTADAGLPQLVHAQQWIAEHDGRTVGRQESTPSGPQWTVGRARSAPAN